MTESDTETSETYRVIWVEQDGSVFKSAWSSYKNQEVERYHDLQDEENVKRVALYEKRKVNQWDRDVGADIEQSGGGDGGD